ncbi:Uma2 family endonuclease [Synechococcales cyanobacterium C]|uniref:Uma2 family endonuclease n=1 Tax=Petrachloros mirabilis ULC683 TaxID=2781853 RepID=A0A8K2A0B8_9CYAN|nr:Uma2 family endonuclease [Petrachloros mirabilis]NCJ07378.1 Uma2 family endonuclease [Petrachloros mirabilis ULC683]
MTVATKKLTLEEYLAYEDESGLRYELLDGELMAMGVGTGMHGAIAKLLERVFDDQCIRTDKPWTAQRFAIAVQSPRSGRWDSARIPDVVVLPIEQWEALASREAVIKLNHPPPWLVVEVVSEPTVSTDYRAKLSEYSVLEIPEYWIVDPLTGRLTLCELVEGLYEQTVFHGNEEIGSPTFPELKLTASQVLAGKL